MYKIFFSLFFLLCVSSAHGEVVRRAVYMLQWDSIQLVIADVDTEKNAIVQNVYTGYEKNINNFYPITAERTISEKGQANAIKALKNLQSQAEAYLPKASHAFAGEMFREAKNAKQVAKKIFDETKLEFTILNGQQEGIVALISTAEDLKASPEKLFVWEQGIRATRLIAKCGNENFVFVLNLPESMFSMVSKISEKKKTSSNGVVPLSQKEFTSLVKVIKDCLKQPPACIKDKVQGKDAIIVGIGDHPRMLLSNKTGYDRAEVEKAVQARLGKYSDSLASEDQATYPAANRQNLYHFAMADLIIITGVMDSLGIKKVNQVLPKNTSVGYLLYPGFWK